ncbi:hypothetical protein [Secundilactobacillus folii]|uniref:Uncharacterized protein n=1 Tax=Secundilactobacillus folii TaxID=2678357 RepID=A0A7X2XUS2_9LACO|nr:hypothetical protein [Secundilactobacillus folii]MTV81993.1 hypothetical protein [Secundilactobacillus folii]
MAEDYANLMAQLKAGQLNEFTVEPKDFMAFQRAYMNFESRKRVVGRAEKNGQIIYHYDHEQTQ